MALNLLRDCKDIKGEEEKKEGCVKHRERSSEVHLLYLTIRILCLKIEIFLIT